MTFKDAVLLIVYSWLSQNFYGMELIIFLATFSLLPLKPIFNIPWIYNYIFFLFFIFPLWFITGY